MKNILLNTWA